MPNWNELLNIIKQRGSVHDIIRREYLSKLYEKRGRNVIAYYSGWLQKPNILGLGINDEDKNGFMSTINALDTSKGLDLILHTPGGETAATESLVDYLRSKFGENIIAIVPQLAMSAGTMISCACKSIIMGRQSSLGPIDPQLGNMAAHGVLEEFKRAREEISADPKNIPLWQPIIAKYQPTLIGECQKAISWSEKLVKEWLSSGMLKDDPDKDSKIKQILKELGDHAITLSHGRHITFEACKKMGLKVALLEENEDPELQDLVLSVHHSFMITISQTMACKIIENHKGIAFIKAHQGQIVLEPPKA